MADIIINLIKDRIFKTLPPSLAWSCLNFKFFCRGNLKSKLVDLQFQYISYSISNFNVSYPEAYSEYCQKSKEESSAKIVVKIH